MNITDLPSMGEVNAQRRAVPKWQIPTRLETKTADAKDDKHVLETWKQAVKARDKSRCRVCGRKTVVTLALDPKRGEAHHIAGRADKAVRTDVRNGLHCCLLCHGKFKHGLHVIATAAQMFTASNGKRYIDCNQPVAFKETK
jgi:hypothetical protein